MCVLGHPEACDYHMKRGWWCLRPWQHEGPCGMLPRWWNIKGRMRMRRRR